MRMVISTLIVVTQKSLRLTIGMEATTLLLSLASDRDTGRKTKHQELHCPGIFPVLMAYAKVGSYTGTANAINVDCGFTNGARFVLIKRTDR